MKLLDRIARRFGYSKVTHRRGFSGAETGRLLADWLATTLSADAEIQRDLRRLLDRCRDLERNDDYVKNFFRALDNNVLGHTGVGLQMKIRDPDGSPDDIANDAVESAWKDWGRRQTCTVSEDSTWLDVQKLVLRSAARDGQPLIRVWRGYPNKFRFALQLFELDQLDFRLNKNLENGNRIRLGVEYDQLNRRVAYWFHSVHPGDIHFVALPAGMQHQRIPAREIIHPFVKERVNQTLGVPWLVSAIKRLRQLGKYEEAELIAARVSAAKMGFFTKQTPDGWQGETDEQGNQIMDVEPGVFEQLPMGVDVKEWDPQHPVGSYQPFVKAVLRGVAAGVGMSYHNLANDLEGVNFSSSRAGILEEREGWKMVQSWFIEHVITPVFEAWLETALLANVIQSPLMQRPLPVEKFDKFNRPAWKARRWPWVDPLKDVKASQEAIASRLTSRRQVISESGGDVEDVFQDNADDERLAEEKGIDLAANAQGAIQFDKLIGDE